MFRITVRTQVVAGAVHYHCRALTGAEDRICGVLVLYEREWVELLTICEAFQIEVRHEALPTPPAHSATAR
jgi:hypothetical protein